MGGEYTKYSAHTLHHMKDWDDFDKIYRQVLNAARAGHSEITYDWKGNNDRRYLINEIKKHFPGVEIHEGDKSIIIEWSNAKCEHEISS